MKNRAFRKFVASIGVAAMVMSTATNAMSPAVTMAESAQALEGQQNDSQEQGGQEDPVAQSSDDTNGAPFADAEPMAVSSEDSQNSQEAVGPSESSDSNGENGTEGSSGENTNASAGSTSADASGAESQGAAGTMSGATNGTAGTTNSTITETTENSGTINGATDTSANGTSMDASTGTTTGENGEASGDNAEASTKEITSVITEDIDLGTYPAGEAPAYAQLELPDEMEVKVDEEKETVTVTWNGEETYHPDQAGTYIFSSELDKEWNKDENGNARYQLAEKVELPKASVRVEKKAGSTEDSKAEVKSDNKTDAKLDIKEDNKTDAKADNKSEGKIEEKSDNKSEVTTKPETTKETTKDTSKENTKETSKKDSASKDKTKDETKGEAKNEAKEENKTDTKDETAKADQKKKVTNAASLKAVYVAEDGTILCGTVGLTGDSFTISDKAKSFNGYELKTVTLGEEELPQDTAFTRNTSTTETKEEIRTEASYTYTMDGAEHEIAAGDIATITFTYAQKEEVTPEIASIEVTGEAVDTTGAAIQGDYAFPLAVGTNDLSKTAPYIQGYEYQYAEIGTDKITSIAKEVLEAGKYAYYVDGELLKENTKITYVYQEDEDYTEQLTGTCGNLTVTVSAKKDAKIPEGTIVRVSPIESARMSQIMAKTSETLGQDPDNVIGVLYDISLDKDGEEIQPKESVHVTMKFDGGIPWNVPEGKQIADTKVVHMHGGETDVVAEAAEDGNAEFETESFSMYGFAAKVAASQDGTVNQGTTIEISATENSAKVGEPLSVTVHATNSTPQNEGTHSEVRINVSQIPDSILCNSVNGKLENGAQFQVIPKDNATPVMVEYHANQDGKGGYFTATIPAGITIEFELKFAAKNGVTENNTAITLTPEIPQKDGNDIVGKPKTLTWSAENKWNPVQKTVDADKIQISQENKTTTKLNYEIKAESLSDETTGMVWTKNVEINDTLTLPSGWNFPEGCTVDCPNGQVKDKAGNVIWALDTTKNPGTQIKEMTINDTTLSFKADVPNTNYRENTTGPKPLDYTRESKSINLEGTLDTAYLILPENEYKNDKVGEKKIENRVEIQPYDLYNHPSQESEDTVTTTPQGNTTEPATEKSVDKTQAKPGEKITYTLTLKNGNTGLPIHGSDKDPGKDQSSDAAYYWAEDKLPTPLTLTKDEIDAIISNNSDLVVQVKKDENTGEYTIRFRLKDDKTLNAGESVSLTILASIKSYQDLQGVNTITNSFSWHGSRSNEVVTSIDQPNVDLTKVVDENAKGGIHDGEETSYTLKVTNNSGEPYDYEDEVTDELPQGLFITNFVNKDNTQIDFRSANSGKYDGTIEGKQVTVNRHDNGRLTLTWKPGEIPAHESVALTYEVIFDATKADHENNLDYVNLKNTAKLKKKGGDGVSVEIPGIIGSTNISKSITKKNDVALDEGTTEAEGQENDVFEFSVTVSNESQDAAYTLPIQVHDVLPEGMFPVGLIVDNNEVKSLSNLTSIWHKYSGKLNGRDVEVQNSNGHCDLFWTVSGLEKGGADTFTYQAKIDLNQITSGSSGQFQLTNTAEENGKKASATIKVKPLKIDKKIVDSDGGEIRQSDISAGQEVTYKLSITNTSSSPITITDAKDILPGTMETASYWKNPGNVIVVSGTGNDDFVSHFTDDSKVSIEQLWGSYSGKAVIFWPSINVPANTTLTQLVKLKYPEGETFGKLFTEGKTENTFQHGEEKATVVHNQATKKYFYMQKGVVELAKKAEYNITAINSKDLFKKDEANFAVYYIVVVNTGNTGDENIHVSSISDSMPYGLSFAGLYDIYAGIKSPLITQYNDYVGLDNNKYTGKSGVQISYSQAAVGAKEVSFSIANGEGVDLEPGEYLTFAVAASIDAGIQLKDTLTNIAYASVDADAKVHSLSINSKGTPNDAVQNNGGCTVVAKNENTQTVESAVSIHPHTGIVPGIEKKAVKYYDKTITGSVWKSLNSDHTTCISSDSAVKWVITLYNDGLEPMTDYKLLDDLDVPFKYVNDFQGYSSIIQIYGSDGKLIGEKNLDVTKAAAAEQAEQNLKPTHYEFSFTGREYQIPAGGKAVVTLISDNPKKTQKLNYIYNNAKLIPDQPFDGNYVLHGQLEQKDGESTYEGVSSGDYVNALGQYGSTSYKTVCEKDNPSNIGYGIRENESGKKRAISVERNAAETDTVVYTNLVQNSSRNPFKNVVVIDRMPEKGDCGVVNQNESRNSEFSVGLPSDANFVVAIDGKPLGNDDYAIRYSNKTSFNDEDFNGTSDWNGSAENAKSFRVVLHKELKPGEKLTIQYDGVISKEAQPGQYAWNSFGYRYKVGGKELTAEPPKVGVTIPSVPKIEKRLLDSSGKETTGDPNYTFVFKDNTDKTKANICLSVKAGSYTEMTPVTTVNGTTSGSFIEGHEYTVTEDLSENSDSHFVSIGQKDGTQSTDNSEGYTFTYHKADNIDIVGTNQKIPGELTVEKTVSDNAKEKVKDVVYTFQLKQGETVVKTKPGENGTRVVSAAEDAEESFTIKGTGSVKITGLEVGKEYTVTETGTGTDPNGLKCTTTNKTATAKLTNTDSSKAVTIANSYEEVPGELTVEKTVSDNAKEKVKDVVYTFQLKQGETVVKTKPGENGTRVVSAAEDAEESFTIKGTGSVKITGLEVGKEYTVTETGTGTDPNGLKCTTTNKTATAKLTNTDSSKAVTIANSYEEVPGELTVEKTVSDNAKEKVKDVVYTFQLKQGETVVKTKPGENGTRVVSAAEDAEESFTIKGTGSVKITGLEVGKEYTVTETGTGTDPNGLKCTTTEAAKIKAVTLTNTDSSKAVTIANSYEEVPGELTVEKTVSDNAKEKVKDVVYTFQLKQGETVVKTKPGENGTRVVSAAEDAEESFTIKGTGSVKITGLEVGKEYTVTETGTGTDPNGLKCTTTEAAKIKAVTLTNTDSSKAVTIANSYEEVPGELTVEKTVSDNAKEKVKDVVYTFQLKQGETVVKTKPGENGTRVVSAAEDAEESFTIKGTGSVKITGLEVGKEYTVTETGTGTDPNGLKCTTTEAAKIKAVTLTNTDSSKAVTIANSYEEVPGELTVEKTVSDNAKEKVKDVVYTFQLKQGETVVKTKPGENGTRVVSAAEDAEESFTIKGTGSVKITGLEVGKEYTVTETGTGTDPNGLKCTTTEAAKIKAVTLTNTDSSKAVTIANSYEEHLSISGSKSWSDDNNRDNKRPDSITVNLFANGTKVQSQEITAAADWKYEFKDLPKYKDGKKITYTITEDAVEGYTPTVDGFNITNTYTPEKVQVSGSKTWDDGNDQDGKRPEKITVNLFADGTKVASQKITAANGWKYEFKDLPKYSNGKVIKYTITEDAVEGYTSTVDGYNITNTYTPEKVQVSGSKNWNDDGNAAGTRPGSITIRLYANGSEIAHKTVTEKDGWSWNWTGLNRYDTDHKEISYTISEDAVEGYTSSISGYNVTNTVNKPQVGSVILTKVDATTGTALAGAVFDLYRANNTKVGTYTTNAGGVLRVDGLTFGDYYFVETKAPEGYALESQRAAFTINAATTVSAPASVRVTNKPVDEKIGVSAAKVWDDENNTDGVRPSSVTFRLFADGVEIGSAQASEANGWTVSFGNLPKTRNGVAISYAVKEDEVGNYYEASYETGLGSDGSYVFTVKNYRETDKHYEERTGSVRGANRNKPSNGGVAGAGRGRGTGDESDMTVYGTVSGASLLALIVWMIARRKRAGKGTK